MSRDFIIFLFWTWNKLQWHIQTYSLFDWNLLSFAICHICYLLHWKFRCFRDMCQLNLNNWCIENIDGAQGLFMFFEIIYLYPCFTCLKILDCSQRKKTPSSQKELLTYEVLVSQKNWGRLEFRNDVARQNRFPFNYQSSISKKLSLEGYKNLETSKRLIICTWCPGRWCAGTNSLETNFYMFFKHYISLKFN